VLFWFFLFYLLNLFATVISSSGIDDAFVVLCVLQEEKGYIAIENWFSIFGGCIAIFS
jgi:hypothetical protein